MYNANLQTIKNIDECIVIENEANAKFLLLFHKHERWDKPTVDNSFEANVMEVGESIF